MFASSVVWVFFWGGWLPGGPQNSHKYQTYEFLEIGPSSPNAYFKERPKAGKLVDLIVPIIYQPLLKIGTCLGASCRADQGAFGLDNV